MIKLKKILLLCLCIPLVVNSNPFERLPVELRYYILSFLYGHSKRISIKKAALTLLPFLNTCTKYRHSATLTQEIIHNLSKHHAITPVEVALALGTPQAGRWLKIYFEQQPAELKKAQELLYLYAYFKPDKQDHTYKRMPVWASHRIQQLAPAYQERICYPATDPAESLYFPHYIRLLITAGFATGIQGLVGYEALTLAVMGANIQGAAVLLEAGANPSLCVSQLCSTYDDIPLLLLAAFRRDHAMITLLLNYGACINAQDSTKKNTALMVAAEQGDIVAVKLLITCGAHKKLKNAAGYTAWHLARLHSYYAIASLLDPSVWRCVVQ